MFPELEVTLKTADALLILEAGRTRCGFNRIDSHSLEVERKVSVPCASFLYHFTQNIVVQARKPSEQHL